MDINLVGWVEMDLGMTPASCYLEPKYPSFSCVRILNEECCDVYLTCYQDLKTLHICSVEMLIIDTGQADNGQAVSHKIALSSSSLGGGAAPALPPPPCQDVCLNV